LPRHDNMPWSEIGLGEILRECMSIDVKTGRKMWISVYGWFPK
jgi:hypothetical protein